MRTSILPETKSQIKTPSADLTNSDLDVHRSGSIACRFSLRGDVDIEINAGQSEEEDTLRQRLTIAGPLIEVLQEIFAGEQCVSQTGLTT